MVVYPTIQRKDSLAEFSSGDFLQRLAVDLHAAVNHINIRQQLPLGTHRLNGCAELRLPVVRQNEVLEEH